MENDTKCSRTRLGLCRGFPRTKIVGIQRFIFLSSRNIDSGVTEWHLSLQVGYSLPTRRQPIPKHSVAIFFTIDVSKIKPKVNPNRLINWPIFRTAVVSFDRILPWRYHLYSRRRGLFTIRNAFSFISTCCSLSVDWKTIWLRHLIFKKRESMYFIISWWFVFTTEYRHITNHMSNISMHIAWIQSKIEGIALALAGENNSKIELDIYLEY